MSFTTTGTSEFAVVNNVNGPYITGDVRITVMNSDCNAKQTIDEKKGRLFLPYRKLIVHLLMAKSL